MKGDSASKPSQEGARPAGGTRKKSKAGSSSFPVAWPEPRAVREPLRVSSLCCPVPGSTGLRLGVTRYPGLPSVSRFLE